MIKQFIDNLISKDSIKLVMSVEAKKEFMESQNVYTVQSLILYRLYGLFAASVDGETKLEERPVFFRILGMYLYYDKFPCMHGTEFYYYIKFNEDSEFYKTHKDFIENMVISNDPSTLKDYLGTRDLTVYNNSIKNKQS